MDNATLASEKTKPSDPFTAADVEVMRLMRLRHIRKKFRLLLGLQSLVFLFIVLWISFIIASYITYNYARLRWMNDWVVVASILLAMVNIAGIVVTARKYKKALQFLEDPSTHPDSIINGEITAISPLESLKKINEIK